MDFMKNSSILLFRIPIWNFIHQIKLVLETEPNIVPQIHAILSVNSFLIGILVYVFIIFLLLFLLAIISGSKLSFFMLKTEALQKLSTINIKKSNRISQLNKNQEQLSTTLLIAGIFTDVTIFIIWIIFFDIYINLSQFSKALVLLIKFCPIVLIVVVFGEIVPRLIASREPTRFSEIAAIPVAVMAFIINPLSKLILQIDHFMASRLVRKKTELTIADLSSTIDLTENTSNENKKILEGIASYGSINTVEIMRPRVDVVAFDISLSFDVLLEKIKDNKHSRIPIYQGTFDTIKGILYLKDLLPHYHKKVFNWQTLIRPVYFVPESKKINDLLIDFQTKKIHMAVVIDEYGGTRGIITLEDVLEEIVGEIMDDVGPDDELFKKIDENNYIFEGKTSLNDFFKIIQIDDNYFSEVKGDADTLAGVFLEMHGEIPKIGKIFPFKEFQFTIIAADKRRIKQIKVSKNI
jgi:putative hemolysin